MATDPRRFVFAPLGHRGAVAGLGVGQLAFLGGGLLVATGLLRSLPGVAGVAGALAGVLVSTAAAVVPIAGRRVDEWVPLVARHGARVATGTRTTVISRGRARPSSPVIHPPPACRGLTFRELRRPAATPIAVVDDAVGRSATAIVPVRGRSFTLLDAADKERRLAAWSAVMAGMAREGGPVRSLQWLERTVPGDADALERHFERGRALAAESPAAASYADLIASAGPSARDHECFVALSVRRTRRRGGVTPDAVLLRELRLLEGQLHAAELDVGPPLSVRGLGAVIRTAFEPEARADIARWVADQPDRDGPLPAIAWPAATDGGWSCWQTDDAWHATFWVAEWPRTEVGADFLSPLILNTTVQRTVAVIMAPLPPSAGVREAEAARTAHVADEQLRQRAGFLATARRRREAEGIARREAELSDGHAAYRFSGYVTVTATTRDELEEACGDVIQAAHQARLELRRLYGIQDLAFTWTLPLGRGLTAR